MSKRSPESEGYLSAAADERRIRVRVAEQARDLIAERERIGSRGEFATRIEAVLRAEQQIAQAMGRQQQAQENGMPIAPHVDAELEGRVLLRQAAMEVAAAAAGWVVAMDFDRRGGAADVNMEGIL